MNPTCMSYWYPRIEAAGLPVPETRMLTTDVELIDLCDGQGFPDGLCAFLVGVKREAQAIGGAPFFLRTGQTSAKHSWARACYVPDLADKTLLQHVAMIAEFSACADFMGLPMNVWAVRKLLATTPLFRCAGFDDFPVTREFRFFASPDGVTHVQPYWPPGAVAQGDPDNPNWRELLAAASILGEDERRFLGGLAIRAAAACGGEWSIDFLRADDGWYLTDMAEGEKSFRWEPSEGDPTAKESS